MSNQFDDPDGRVLVLANEERPYSLWPESAAAPGGWVHRPRGRSPHRSPDSRTSHWSPGLACRGLRVSRPDIPATHWPASSADRKGILMYRTMLKSKIHRATVTQCDLNYVGSLTIDLDLMEAADLLPGELIHLVDIDNGSRLETYVIEGPRGSGVIGVNGAAARLIQRGDLVIIIAYASVPDAEARHSKPSVVFVDARNHIVSRDDALAAIPVGHGLISGDSVAAR